MLKLRNDAPQYTLMHLNTDAQYQGSDSSLHALPTHALFTAKQKA